MWGGLRSGGAGVAAVEAHEGLPFMAVRRPLRDAGLIHGGRNRVVDVQQRHGAPEMHRADVIC